MSFENSNFAAMMAHFTTIALAPSALALPQLPCCCCCMQAGAAAMPFARFAVELVSAPQPEVCNFRLCYI